MKKFNVTSQFYRDQSMSKAPKKYNGKVILVGASGVGKTSLVGAFFDNPFESQALPTVAPASCSATIDLEDGTKVELQIWDTAGQERFQSISHMFYRDSHIAFVCYDHQTGASVENWIAKVRDEVPECVIFLVSTKGDLLDDEALEKCKQDGEEKMKAFDAKYHIITSASKCTGVKELFTAAGKCVKDVFIPNSPVVVTPVPDQTRKDGCC